MKKGLSLFLSLILSATLLSGCGTNTETNMRLGDEAFAAGEYEKAVTYYQQSGTEGREKLREAHIAQARKLANYNYGSFHRAEDYLLTDAAAVVSQEEVDTILVEFLNYHTEVAQEQLSEKLSFSEDVESIRSAIDSFEMDLYDLLESAEASISSDTPGMSTAVSNIHYLKATTQLDLLCDHLEEIDWDTVITEFSKCTEGPGAEIGEAIQMIKTGNHQEGAAVLKSHFNEDVTAYIYWNDSEYLNYKNLSQILSYHNTGRNIYPPLENTPSLQETFSSINQYYAGDKKISVNIPVSEAELKESCGKNPEGKILFLHRHSGGIDYDTVLMNWLPDSYYPETLESVEYVILMEGQTVLTGGVFECGTKAARENTTVTLYSASTGKALWSAKVEGSEPFFMSYYGEPPEIYTGGAPNVANEIKLALEKIN